MKKRNNKILILTIVGIIFITLFGIFILNYSKDDASFSILEKKWISDNKRNVIDVSVFNDVPVYGKDGNGVIFDFLDDFTEKYGINFNKVSYLSSTNDVSFKENSFRILDNGTDLSNNDLLIYEDHYVLVGKDDKHFDSVVDIGNIEIAVFSSDVGIISSALSGNNMISYVVKDNISEIEEAFDSGKVSYAIIPYNKNMDFILKRDLHIAFHLNDIVKKYVLTIENRTFCNIVKKYYTRFKKNNQSLSYKKNFLDEYFNDKEISETDKMGYNSVFYNVGYTTYMPFENVDNKSFVGNLSNYFSEFEDVYDIDFNYIYYDNIESLKKAFSDGELDIVFGNFDTSGLNIDVIKTSSLFKEEYVILSKNVFNVISPKSLANKEVMTVKDSYLNSLVTNAGISFKVYNNTDELLRKVSSDSIIIIDADTYNYYKVKKFSDFKELYRGILPYEYSFYIRDVNKNTNMANMFSYYIETVNYNSIRYNYNTTFNNYNTSSLISFIVTLLVILLLIVFFILIKKKIKNDTIVTNNDKLKYIDSMTSLKNRNYLNLKMKEWDENTIYPQGFVIVDLNNIKYINDSHGHEEGDIVIKKAASVLIVNQASNTDIIRTDGNEFLIYMVGYDENDIVNYTRKIYKELKELPYGFGASIGYSMIFDDTKTVDDAINDATIDMRNKKKVMQGKNN